MNPIVGLVGPSGSGKTTLIEAMVARFPERVGILKSLTTRARRGPEDDVNYDFVSVEEMRAREKAGRLVQVSAYAGNLYAHDRDHCNGLLEEKIGICALVEQGVRNLRNAGYEVIVVGIVPENWPGERDAARAQADKQRAASGLEPDYTITNSFEPGGLTRAEDALAERISRIV
ncbi:MAG TPA: ATP-binding cassette domain-containing protein [Verrucomicrobiae bacterium]|nr:ATP-binding cassette domain-containing protein [Verrucomicrobiae bacterium]